MEPVVLAVVAGLGLGPHAAHDLHRFAHHADALLRPAELEAIALVFVLVPAGAYAPIEPTAADHVDGGRDLRQHAGIAVAVATDHLAEAHTGGALADRCHRCPALEDGFVRRLRDVVKVVVHPDRVVAELLDAHRNVDRGLPLGLGTVNRGQLHLPSLGHEHAEEHLVDVTGIDHRLLVRHWPRILRCWGLPFSIRRSG